MATIFERYGYSRNLTFALSVKGNQVLSRQKHFNRKFVLQLPGITDQHFDLLTNHARYQRKEMEAVVPNATYITILRRPEDQLESVLGYFEVYRATGIANESNPLGKFMDDPLKYYEMHTRKWEMLRNGMLHDLGFDPKFSEDTDKILQTISKLGEEFDLVLLTEYFDESLVLMKNMLCWGFDDILYLAHGVRSKSHRVEMTESLREKIRKWSHGDVLLYEHFNKTFWNKVAEYGSNFRKDLDYFITLNQAMTEDCVDSGKFDKHDQRIDRLVLKNNSELCNHLLRDEPIFTRMIRKSMIRRFGKTD